MAMRDASVDSGSAARIRVTIYASERRFEVMSFGGNNEKARKKAEKAVRDMSFDDMQALMKEVSE
jgi:biotin carboxylase